MLWETLYKLVFPIYIMVAVVFTIGICLAPCAVLFVKDMPPISYAFAVLMACAAMMGAKQMWHCRHRITMLVSH